nr:UvrD-helicase domain-containing protein [Burkholderia gladioli]
MSTSPPKACSDEQLLAYGVPTEWIGDVKATDEESLLEISDHLPSEAAEALLELATGGMPTLPAVMSKGTDPFQHPDAQRRFRVMSDVEELQRALEFPWDKWTVFLHPAQRQMVERDYSGAARVSGSAGTGKTVVALHRAVQLARKNEDARILLSTFSETLANVLRSNLFRLTYNTPKLAERLDVVSMDTVGIKLYSAEFGKPVFANREEISSLLKSAAKNVDGLKDNTSFLLSEWDDVVDTWQVENWEAYRDAKRLGRKTRLPEAQRALYWQVFAKVKEQLRQAGKITKAEMFDKLAGAMLKRKHPVFDYIVVDEAQDIGVQQLRFLASIAGDRPNGLFFAGDLGQRIFRQPFSWKLLGVDIRGRSRTLNINYRTSHQIRSQADLLLGPEVSDVDGNVESRKGTISIFNGPEPVIRSFDSSDLESQAVGQWLKQSSISGVLPHEIGVFVRSEDEFPRALAAIAASGLIARVLGKDMATEEGFVSVTTMHLAKGMEFRVVAVMACDDEIIPSQARIDLASDDAELTEIYNTERQLLYVACTRARDQLHVSAVKPGSEFLQDLMQK